MKKALLFFICLQGVVMLPKLAAAQNVAKIPYPEGPAASLDTIFYTPNTSMPFDQRFVLKMTLKGNPSVSFFGVVPIDRLGNVYWTRHDYNVYMKIIAPNRKYRDDTLKKSRPYKKFKTTDLGILNSSIKTYNKGTTTDVYLHVPPLAPNRQYKIVLFTQDADALKSLFSIGTYFFKTAVFPPTQTELDNINTKLNLLSTQNNPKNGHYANPMTAAIITEMFARDTLVFLQNVSDRTPTMIAALAAKGLKADFQKDSSFVYRKKYRLFFKPAASHTAIDATNALRFVPYKYIDVVSKKNPVRVELEDKVGATDQLMDIDGGLIDFHKNSSYEVYLLCYEELTETSGKNPPVDAAVSVSDFGLLEEKSNGLDVAFTVNPNGPGADQISLNKNMIRSYKTADDAQTILNTVVTYKKDDDNDYKAIMAQAVVCPCSDKGIKDMSQASDLFHIIGLLTVATPAQLDNIRSGLLSSKDILATSAKKDEYTTRQANIKYSLTQFQILVEFMRNLRAHDPANASFINVYITTAKIVTDLQTANDTINTILKLNGQITAAWQKRYQGAVEQTDLVTTEPLDFMSTNKLRIIPDFGFMGVFTGARILHISDLAPYLGFEVDFRSINKNLPMKLVYNKTVWYYLSFSAGLTLTSLAIPNKRTDLFGNQNIYTGLGFRLNNSLRITAGTVWFKTVNTDPLQTNQPLGFSPYIGLSLDLDLQTLFGGINKLFK